MYPTPINVFEDIYVGPYKVNVWTPDARDARTALNLSSPILNTSILTPKTLNPTILIFTAKGSTSGHVMMNLDYIKAWKLVV